MLFVDVDALCKLAHWNILPILPELTQYHWRDIATLASLQHRAHRAQGQPDVKLFHSTNAAVVACECIVHMGGLPDPNPEILATLGDIPQIDAGEAVLLALTASDPHGCFLTGDKRALRALAQHETARAFAGRIMTLEQVLSLCLRAKGREWLLENVCPYKHIDKAISAILGSRCDSSLESLADGIDSYVNEMARLHDPAFLVMIGAALASAPCR